MGPSGLEDREAETQRGEPVKESYRGQISLLYASETSTASRAGGRASKRASMHTHTYIYSHTKTHTDTHTHLKTEIAYGNEALLESH